MFSKKKKKKKRKKEKRDAIRTKKEKRKREREMEINDDTYRRYLAIERQGRGINRGLHNGGQTD